ncbi:MAG: hypothetical protein V3U87_15030 [Methylococcaceae bacterium]
MNKKANAISEIINNLNEINNLYTDLSTNSEDANDIIDRKKRLISRFLIPLSQGELRPIWYISHGALSRPLVESPYPNIKVFEREQEIDNIIFDLCQKYVKEYGEPVTETKGSA